MRTLCIMFFCLLSVALVVQAQDSDSGKNTYLVAEEAYRDGQFKKAIRLLEQDMKNYDHILVPNACRLLALCYMALDRNEK
ncbi:tol-pal system YbgF family protein, partial [Bacteroides sp.]|uniref:tetratricopeptide repeat protein n=1 Tax=Bacteroides sp. TaxID=29523 RepID=UPI0026372254